MRYIIVAPHADDEIIGCYELLSRGLVDTVLFPNDKQLEEAVNSSEHFMFTRTLFDDYDCEKQGKIFLFPDPTYELHPNHKYLGHLGEELLRRGQEVIFYTTNMLAPYIHEVSQPLIKQKCLNTLYPTKKDLWEFEHKYFLFEGYTQWLMKWQD
jgi:hypothetical protein